MKYHEIILSLAIASLFYSQIYQNGDIELFYKFTQFSLTLAGFALTAGVFYYKNNEKKEISNGLFDSSFSFLSAGIFFMLFPALLSFAQFWNPELDFPDTVNMTIEQKEQVMREYNQNRISGIETLLILGWIGIAIYNFVKGITFLINALEKLSHDRYKNWYKFWFKKCNICGNRFKNDDLLRRHKEETH